MNKSTGLMAGRPSARKSATTMADVQAKARVNVIISEEEHEKIKLYAVKNKTTITQLFKNFIATL